jgi:hypothetical protein
MGTRTAWVFLAALCGSGSACSSPESLSGPGGSCLMVTDCQLGFVCYKNACTSNLAGLVHIEDAGGSYDAPVQGVPDASMPPPVEAGMDAPGAPEASTTLPDATQPPADATSAPPGAEAATPTPEASPPPDASGSAPEDAASGG